jgi:3',5'-nucleoside bisphosphate phosphatase
VVLRARRHGVATLALTDHDTMEGVPEAMDAGTRLGVRVVPGVELSARVPSGSLHLLGYFSHPAPSPLVERLDELRRTRVDRAREMVERLAQLGAPLDWNDVAARAEGSLGRPHIADALVAAGHARDRAEAFSRFLGDDRPAYVPSAALEPDEAICLVTEAGGAAVLAHPYSLRMGRDTLRAFVAELRLAGLQGVEVHRPDHSVPDAQTLADLARDLGLLPCGGSDFHHPDGPVELGDTGYEAVSSRVPDDLLTRGIR